MPTIGLFFVKNNNNYNLDVKILFISRLFSGLEKSVIDREWKPNGVNTIYKMIEYYDQNFRHLEIILTSKDGYTSWKKNKKKKINISGLKSTFHILQAQI